MNAPAIHFKIDAVLVLKERAEARAYLWAAGEFDLHEAVDRLAVDAEREGINTDTAQAILAEAFGAVR
jgi:hypothetical protein